MPGRSFFVPPRVAEKRSVYFGNSSFKRSGKRALAQLAEAQDTAALEQLRVSVLGKKGELTGILRGMGKLPAEERPKMGQMVNETRAAIEEALETRATVLREKEKEERLKREAIDVTMPVRPPFRRARPNPLYTRAGRIGGDFRLAWVMRWSKALRSSTTTTTLSCSTLPKNHPARDAQDTFYIDDNIVLRTHHLARAGAHHDPRAKPPIRIVCPGRVYRADEADATHSPVFHQMEGLVIDEGVTMGDLKGTLDAFARAPVRRGA